MKKNILIIKHGSFGDIIRSSGIIECIKSHHKNSKLFLLTSSPYKTLMLMNPFIDEVIIDDRKSFYHFYYHLNLIKIINKYSFKIIYDLQNSQRTQIYKNLFLKKYQWISTNREKHEISGIQGLVDMLSKNMLPTKNALNPKLNWIINDVSSLLANKEINKNFVLILPGSSRQHKEKRWPYYPELINLLLNKKYQVATVLGPDELELEKKIPGIIFKKLNWGDLGGIINASSFVVSNDTGPIHIASCLKKKGVVIFGPTTSSIRTGLKSNNFKIITSPNLNELKPQKVLNQILRIATF
jgi:ADP-heptose:LPS heptosyltransferase